MSPCFLLVSRADGRVKEEPVCAEEELCIDMLSLTPGSLTTPALFCPPLTFDRNAPKWQEIRFIQRQKQTFQVQNWQTGSHQRL